MRLLELETDPVLVFPDPLLLIEGMQGVEPYNAALAVWITDGTGEVLAEAKVQPPGRDVLGGAD